MYFNRLKFNESTGQFLTYLLPALVLAGLISFAFHLRHASANYNIIQARELNHIQREQQAIVDDFLSITGDLEILAGNPVLLDYLETGGNNNQQKLTELFLSFSSTKRIYSQICFIDEKGMEQLKIDFNDGQVKSTPESGLRDKSQYSYFSDTAKLKRGIFSMSPMDMGNDKGLIDTPLKPIMHFGAPVFDRFGIKRGAIILNFIGSRIIKRLQDSYLPSPGSPSPVPGIAKVAQETDAAIVSGEPMLINASGFWLLAPDPSDEWGFMLGHERTFANRYPAVWEEILLKENGQVRNKEGMFTYTTIKPISNMSMSHNYARFPQGHSSIFLDHDDFFWKVVSFVSAEKLAQTARRSKNEAVMLFVLLSGIIIPACRQMAKTTAYQKASEKALQAGEEKFTTVADYTYSWEYWLDPTGRFLYVSPAVERISGYTAEEFLDDPDLLNRIIHPEDKAGFTSHIDYEIHYSGACHLEFRIITKNGDERWILHSCHPVRNKKGDNLGRRASNHDFTLRKLGEIERERLIGELKEANAKVKTLYESLPPCPSCNKMLVDQGYRNQIESYIKQHCAAECGYGICPDGARKFSPDFDKSIKTTEKES